MLWPLRHPVNVIKTSTTQLIQSSKLFLRCRLIVTISTNFIFRFSIIWLIRLDYILRALRIILYMLFCYVESAISRWILPEFNLFYSSNGLRKHLKRIVDFSLLLVVFYTRNLFLTAFVSYFFSSRFFLCAVSAYYLPCSPLFGWKAFLFLLLVSTF